VAPASANFIRKLAQGITDSPTSALAASYLGMKKPVLVMPNMHSSLADAPAVAQNLAQVANWAHVLHPRVEEGKHKFAEPADLADRIAHQLNQNKHSVMLAYGGCKAFIDDVRYIANYSTGALGTLVGEELYRYGYQVHALEGVVQNRISMSASTTKTETYDDLAKQARALSLKGVEAIVFMSSVLDYVPESTQKGKIRSGQNELTIKLVPTAKILPSLVAKSGIKIGFKLEPELQLESAKKIAAQYIKDNALSLFVMNALTDVSASTHKALIFDHAGDYEQVEGKRAVAQHIVKHIRRQLSGVSH
jgi:phosphopantothenoylcysteine decarboxylase/phosphopantothenate--cysteine ligase